MDSVLYQEAAQRDTNGLGGADGAAGGSGRIARLALLATSPGEPRSLLARLRWGLLVVAALLLASGLIFWIAANWQDQSRMFKLMLIEAALGVSVLASVLLPRLRIPALFCANLALGGLLAFVGQTYQTGADAWQLFAAWAALSLVWTAIARSDLLWTLWVAVAAAGITLWIGRLEFADVLFSRWRNVRQDMLHMFLWLLLALVPFVVSRIPLLRTAEGTPWWAHRIALALALMAWMTIAMAALFEDPPHLASFFLSGALIAAALWLAYRRGPARDFISLCLVALAANVWIMSAIVRMLVEHGDVSVLLIIAIAGLICLGTTVTTLLKVQREMQSEAQALQGDAA